MKISRIIFTTLTLLAILILQGCPATSSKLNSLKKEYNAGHFSRVLNNTKDSYSASEIIAEAHESGDTLTENQAKLIKARALVSLKIEGQLIARKEGCASKEVAEAIKITKELQNGQLQTKWMRIEAIAMVADVHQICGRKMPAFLAYDYLLTHHDFTTSPLPLQRYITRWYEAYYRVADSDMYKDIAKKQFKKTFKILKERYPTNKALIYVVVLQQLHEGKIIEAVQGTILFRAYVFGSSAKDKDLISKIDKEICTSLKKYKKFKDQYYLYQKILKQWDGTDYICVGLDKTK